jgi:hypothetical protein
MTGDGEDRGEDQRRAQQRQLDMPDRHPRTGAVDAGGLVQLRGDGTQLGDENQDVVAGELPRDDVRDRPQNRVSAQQVDRHPQVAHAVHERADSRYVQEAPQDGRDDARNAVGQEESGTEEPHASGRGTVQQQREPGGQRDHHRHLDGREQQYATDAAHKGVIGQRVGVVAQPYEDGMAT